MPLSDINTFVFVTLENRSFDHMCGYLSLPSAAPPMAVEGLQDSANWRGKFANDDTDGTAIQPHLLEKSVQNIADPPHEDDNIRTQISTPTHAHAFPSMGGFVKSYADASPTPDDRSLVMGYYNKEAVPVFDFLARNYVVCDHWFSSLPAGTQPNRLMAMAGESQIHHNVSDPLDFPNQRLVYDWLDENLRGDGWCCYQWDGLPFFSLMAHWWPRILAGRNDPYGLGQFRRYDRFEGQWLNDTGVPKVIFIEPKYTDDPTFSFHPRNDDHCPTGISEGQRFLANIYNTLIGNDQLWKSVALIVSYDEHGGFFDHVPPPAVPVQVGGINFATAGVRVPAFVISPYVKQGGIFSAVLDHTAILQLLADRFTPGKEYSPAVAARQKYFEKLAPAFDNPLRTAAPPKISQAVLNDMHTGSPAMALHQEISKTKIALNRAAEKMASLHSDRFAVA